MTSSVLGIRDIIVDETKSFLSCILHYWGETDNSQTIYMSDCDRTSSETNQDEEDKKGGEMEDATL